MLTVKNFIVHWLLSKFKTILVNLIAMYFGLCNWWALVGKSWGRVNNYPKLLPFYSNFDQVATNPALSKQFS